MDGKTWEGIQSLLDNYAAVGKNDFVLLLYTSDSAEPAAWLSAALEYRNISTRRVWMEPLYDEGFADRLAAVMPAPTDFTGRMVVLTLERDTLSHHKAISKALSPFDRSRRVIYRAINASASLFSTAMRAAPADLSARNTAILERCLEATHLRVKSPGGTDLRITLDNEKFRWVSNRGDARVGGTVVLPAGEVATFPATVDGVLVADFAFNVNIITDRDARLHTHPVKVWVENRQAVRWECDDPDTMTFLNECFEKYGVHNVGELGFGTNFAVDEGIALNSHINERRPGVHLGFGQHNQDPKITGYKCDLHLDLIAKGALMWIDDDPVPLDLENIVPSSNSHPISPRDEDAFSPEEHGLEAGDCCGILTCDGLKLAETEEELVEMAR